MSPLVLLSLTLAPAAGPPAKADAAALVRDPGSERYADRPGPW